LAKALLDKLIREDEFWYPQAHYYKALILINESENSRTNLDPILRELHSAEALLDEHVQLQMTFASVVTKIHDSKKQASFFPREFYKEQKENSIHLLEIFKGSIHQILGSCISESDLERSADLSTGRARRIFKTLNDLKVIDYCRLTPSEVIPDMDKSLVQICNDYGLQVGPVKTKLRALLLHQDANEEDLERKLTGSNLLQWTRKKFWTTLVKEGILTESTECLIISKTDLDEDLKKIPELFTKETQILYNPVISIEDLSKQEKVILPKDVVKAVLGSIDYKEKKKKFESNKVANLNLEKLRQCDLSCFGTLSYPDDLIMEGITDEGDRRSLWRSLVDLGYIDETGKLIKYDQPFEFPSCPAFGSAVENALQRKFVAAGILKRWQDPEDVTRHTAIQALAMKPYRSLLMDLINAKIISSPRVKVSANLEDSGGLAGMLLNNFNDLHNSISDEKERNKIVAYLKSNQAAYANLETIKASLEPVNSRLQESEERRNIGSEVQSFALVGFDDVIELSEKKWSFKMICRAIAVIAIGLAQVVLGAIVAIKSAGFMTHVSSGLISEGVSDILFGVAALWSGNNFTWADYGKHKLESMISTAGIIF